MIDPGPFSEGQARWYVVQTRPAKETLAVINLKRQGFAPFLPQIRRAVRQSRRTREVMRPLFPRYLFVNLDLTQDRWRPILGTLGVSSMIMEGERPRAAPRGLVEDFMVAADSLGRLDLKHRLAVGDRVRMLRGPFAERVAELVDLQDHERVAVLLEVLGAQRRVTVDASDLMPVSPT